MFSMGPLNWLFGNQNLTELLAGNWLLGTSIVAGVIFLETGLVIFPFLPGDSLLLATGAFMGINGIQPFWAILIIGSAAVLGDLTNYLIGRSRLGQRLIAQGWISQKHLNKTRAYFTHFGAPTITLGRFVPVVRTVAPFLAGLIGMSRRRFALYNVLGAALWCTGLVMSGFWLGGNGWIQTHSQWLLPSFITLTLIPVLLSLKRGLHAAGG